MAKDIAAMYREGLAICRAYRNPKMDRLLREAAEAVRNMTPEQYEAMIRRQRESWVRGEMGLPD